MGSIRSLICWGSPVGIHIGFPLGASSKGFFGVCWGLLLTFEGPEGCMLVAMVVHSMIGVCFGSVGPAKLVWGLLFSQLGVHYIEGLLWVHT